MNKTFNTEFRLDKTTTGILLCNSQGLVSAYQDAKHLYQFLLDSGCQVHKVWVGLNTQKDRDNFHQLYPTSQTFLLTALVGQIHLIETQIKPGDSVFVSLSSHGYSGLPDTQSSESDHRNEYINIGGKIFSDDQLRQILVEDLSQKDQVTVFSLIDTCSSGTMLDLPWTTTNGQDWKVENKYHCSNAVFSISACSDSQSSMDDLSYMGWGGGLVSAFLDLLDPKGSEMQRVFNITELFLKIRLRLVKLSQQAILSSSLPY